MGTGAGSASKGAGGGQGNRPGQGFEEMTLSMDTLLRDVETCYDNVDVALRRNESDQV